MMDFATNKRGHSDSTDEEPLSKKLSPDADGPTPKGLKRIGGGKWASVGATLLIYTTDGIEASSKIAGFDMGNFFKENLKVSFAHFRWYIDQDQIRSYISQKFKWLAIVASK